MCSQCKPRGTLRAPLRNFAVAAALAPVFVVGGAVVPVPDRDLSTFIPPAGIDGPALVANLAWGVPAAQAGAPAENGGKTKWTCPMHPHYIADAFGPCPICGMDLVKLDTGGSEGDAAAAEERTIITVSPEVIQNIGVRLGKVEQTRFGRSVRSYGLVHENERLTTEFTARVEGWVQDLKVTAVGDEVKEGDLLFRLYSPRLIVSQGDFFASLRSPTSSIRGTSQLRAFGVQNRTIAELKQHGQPMELVPFYADRTGTVTELGLKEGSYVNRGMMLARIQDYSTVWLRVSVAERDLSFIARSTPAAVSFPNIVGMTAAAQVDYVYPTIDSKTRTGQVRLVIPNKDGVIRPGSYADVVFDVGATDRTAVKSEAILRTGDGSYVVVSLGQGRFEPRAVTIGLVSGDWTEVTQGLKVGEDIVLSGQFLLDSESALRESFRKLQRLQLPLSLLKLTTNQQAMVDHLVDAALYIHEALVDGYDLQPAAIDPAISIRDLLWPRFKDTKLAFVLDDSIAALQEAKKAATEREVQAALARLVTALRPWLMEGTPDHYRKRKLVILKDKESGRYWLQLRGRALNPYGRGAADLVPWPETAQPDQTGSKPQDNRADSASAQTVDTASAGGVRRGE